MTTDQHPSRYGWVASELGRSFHDSWWGSYQQLAVNSAVELPLASALDIILPETKGRVFIREEYFDFHTRLETSYRRGLGGRVVCGAPGIGKSVFLLYVLAERLKDRQITLFYTASDILYLFYTDGIYIFPGTFSAYEHLRPFTKCEQNRVWILIDSGATAACPSFALTNCDFLFPIQASGPSRGRYDSWLKHNRGARYIMNPWTVQELHQALALHINDLTVDDVRQARERFGPNIRDVCIGLSLPDVAGLAVEDAMRKTRDISQLKRLAEAACDAWDDHHAEALSHELFTIYRVSADVLNRVGPDRAFVELKTLGIAKQLQSQHENLKIKDAQCLYRLCSPFPETSIFAGWLFEKIAVKYLSGPTSASSRVIKGLHAMEQTTNSDSPSFEYTSYPEDPSQLRVNVAPWHVEIDEKHPPPVKFRSVKPITLPIETRLMDAYEDFKSLSVVLYHYFYVSKAKNHPLFDAFFCSSPRPGKPSDPVTLWIFQMTTSALRGGSRNGYDDVRHLRAKLAKGESHFRCIIKYVLVVPERQHQSIIWKMPTGWQDDVKGEVYVQFLAMDEFSNALLE